MKNILLAFSLSVLVLFTSCNEDYTLGEHITEDQIDWNYHETEVSNVYAFENTTEGVISAWDFGNGSTSQNAIDTAIYPMAGTYTVTLTVLSNGGETKITENIVVANTNYSFMEGEFFDNLIGDKNAAVPKKWVIDRYYDGQVSIGESFDNYSNWWSAGSNAKDASGLYEDTVSFLITDAGLEYRFTTNGTVCSHSDFATELGDTTGHREPGTGDFIMPVADISSVWFVNGDETEISFADGGFMGYFTGVPSSYRIITLTENVLEVVSETSTGGAFWFQRFVTVDNLSTGIAPEPEPVEKVSITSLMDYFNGNSLLWDLTGDSTELETTYTTEDGRSVGAFTRKDGDVFAEMHTDLDGVIDFTYGVQIRMDVFVPTSNVYTPGEIGEWWSFPVDEDDCKTLEVKLHNTLKEGSSWETQLTLKTDVLRNYEGQWVTLVFDFNDVYAAATDNADRDYMDRVIVQFGGEGWSYNPGISVFYDNILGLESVNDPISTKSASAYPVVVIK